MFWQDEITAAHHVLIILLVVFYLIHKWCFTTFTELVLNLLLFVWYIFQHWLGLAVITYSFGVYGIGIMLYARSSPFEPGSRVTLFEHLSAWYYSLTLPNREYYSLYLSKIVVNHYLLVLGILAFGCMLIKMVIEYISFVEHSVSDCFHRIYSVIYIGMSIFSAMLIRECIPILIRYYNEV